MGKRRLSSSPVKSKNCKARLKTTVVENEKFTTVFIGGESDGEIIKTDNESSGHPKIVKDLIYKFLYVHFASKTQFYFFAEELNQYEAQNRAQEWLNKNSK